MHPFLSGATAFLRMLSSLYSILISSEYIPFFEDLSCILRTGIDDAGSADLLPGFNVRRKIVDQYTVRSETVIGFIFLVAILLTQDILSSPAVVIPRLGFGMPLRISHLSPYFV